MNENLDSLEAVYYSAQVPSSRASLTMLGFLFDRIHFPGVYMPDHARLDVDGVKKEIERIAAYKNPENHHLLNCLGFTIVLDKVRDFCVFDDTPVGGSSFDEQAKPLALEIEQAIFGPYPDDCLPMSVGHYHKALPGEDAYEMQLSYPRWSTYNANAYIYAAKNGLLLVNDDARIPILGIPEHESLKNQAKALAAILTMECVKLALPKLKPLSAGVSGVYGAVPLDSALSASLKSRPENETPEVSFSG